jgi:hypothetical protein
MRWIAFVTLAACQHGPAPASTPGSPPEATCDQVADHLAGSGANRAAIATDCTRDGWSAGARACLATRSGCDDTLTPAQRTALDRDRAAYKNKTDYNFDDDTIEGDLVKPDGDYVEKRRGEKQDKKKATRTSGDPCEGGQ